MKDDKCSTDGLPCVWVTDVDYVDDGNPASETYCEKCFRLRVWKKNRNGKREIPQPGEVNDSGRV